MALGGGFAGAECAVAYLGGDALENHAGEKLGRRIAALETRVLVEVAIVQLRKHEVQDVARSADVDDQAVGVELGAPKLDVDDVSGAVHLLGGSEHLAGKAMGDHEVVAHCDAEHALGLRGSGIFDAMAQSVTARRRKLREQGRQVVERTVAAEQRIERGLGEQLEREA